MTPTDSTQTFTGKMKGKLAYFVYVASIITAVVACWPLVVSIANGSSSSIIILLAVTIPVGIGLPLMMCTMHVRVQLTPQMYRASLWPFLVFGLIFKRFVPWANVSQVERRTISSFWDYGGYGVKGTPNDLLYSVGGKGAVTVHYWDDNKERVRMVTVTVPEADALYQACLTHTNQP